MAVLRTPSARERMHGDQQGSLSLRFACARTGAWRRRLRVLDGVRFVGLGRYAFMRGRSRFMKRHQSFGSGERLCPPDRSRCFQSSRSINLGVRRRFHTASAIHLRRSKTLWENGRLQSVCVVLTRNASSRAVFSVAVGCPLPAAIGARFFARGPRNASCRVPRLGMASRVTFGP